MLKRVASLVGAVAFAFVALAGCNDSPASPETSSFDKATVVGTVDGSFEQENLFRDPPTNPGGERGNRPPMPPGQRKPGLSIERIIRLLELTEDQVPGVRSCLQAHKECMDAINADIREARQAAMETFRAAVAAIRAEVEAGTKTREEAREAIAEASAAAREAMKAAMEGQQEAMEECKADLDECMDAILDDTQFAKWQRLTQPPPRRP